MLMKDKNAIIMNSSRALLIVLITAIFSGQMFSEEYKYAKSKPVSNLKETTAACGPASAYDWLDVNNVRARINSGGDMWWDLPGGVGSKYYIPKAGTATSVFAGALWIGGLDINNQLKLAAQRFRQVGVDYWTGPLSIDGTASTDEESCAEYDRFWKITRPQVDEFLSHTDPVTGYYVPSEDYSIPSEILNWPAHGDISKDQSYYLAPFYDNNGDGEYEPEDGDYPYYDLSNELCHTDIPTMEEEYEGTVTGSILADQVIKGDQTLWWVFNDKGNIHSESQGSAIGLEIRAQAFAFATNDVINNMTFYSYEIINRSTFELTQTYFSPWIDTDLGYAQDDFVGCDVNRGLGYCYNGQDVDGSGEVEAYGAQPPAVGVDFFQGPYMDPDDSDNPAYNGPGEDGPTINTCDIVSWDGTWQNLSYGPDNSLSGLFRVDAAAINGVNFGNGIVDDERFGMRRFVYHNNDASDQGDPQIAPEYYNYLKGIWRNGEKMIYGGDAFSAAGGAVGPACDFMFPYDSDPCNWGTGGQPPNGGWNVNGNYWSEEKAGPGGTPNPPGDRRFMQSAGPFTLKSGAVNYITVGVPWARAQSGGAWESVVLLRVVDDKCQALFDNCFKVIDGPTAPDITITELDRRLIFYITNSPISNNYQESYNEFDPNIIQPLPGSELEPDGPYPSDPYYRFEGYQIYQLKNDEVSVESLHDPDLARLVAQFDIKNGVTKIVNYYFDDNIGFVVPVIEVIGGDNGIKHSFELTEDAFATGDVTLVNNKEYYYLAIAYAYNNYLEFGLDYPNSQGQTHPYLSGRKNIGDKTNGGLPYQAVPHKTINGTVINSDYGESPVLTRIAGHGNGGLVLDLSQETEEEILSKPPAGPDNLFGGPDYPIAYNPVYVVNGGPLNVKIVNPLDVRTDNFEWWLDTLALEKIYNVTEQGDLRGDTTSKYVGDWNVFSESAGKTTKSDTTIMVQNEQLFPDYGFSIEALQPFFSGPYAIGTIEVDNAQKTYYTVLAPNNGLLESSITYSDSSKRWLSGIEDLDVPGHPLDWIRSGTHKEGGGAGTGSALNNDWNMAPEPPNPWDPNGAFEKILNGTWAPYGLTSYGINVGELTINTQSQVGPAMNSDSKFDSELSELASVDIVLTPDKSLWTRSPVLEMSFDEALAEGNVNKFALRASPSVDKDGNPGSFGSGPSESESDPNYISDHGMGWFPGYAINIETGERLNIMFGEDSYLVAQNGRDMLFNPPARQSELTGDAQLQILDQNIFSGAVPNVTAVMGGKHYVYIMAHKTERLASQNIEFKMPAYDAGRYAVSVLDTLFQSQFVFLGSPFFATCMYVGMPMGIEGQEWLSNEVRIRIRMSVPYQQGYSDAPLDTVYPGMDINNGYPMYQYSMDGFETEYNNPEKAESDLDEIRVVPNPYYAYSSYEKNPLETTVKITNLPEQCTITIYNIAGTKVRQFTKDSPLTSIEWDLNNFATVPVAGGVYYIHVVSDSGEVVVKFFMVQRIPDLNTF